MKIIVQVLESWREQSFGHWTDILMTAPYNFYGPAVCTIFFTISKWLKLGTVIAEYYLCEAMLIPNLSIFDFKKDSLAKGILVEYPD